MSNFTRELVHLGKIVEEEMVKFLPKKNEFPHNFLKQCTIALYRVARD